MQPAERGQPAASCPTATRDAVSKNDPGCGPSAPIVIDGTLDCFVFSSGTHLLALEEDVGTGEQQHHSGE